MEAIDSYFSFLRIPKRRPKPRSKGVTIVTDKSLRPLLVPLALVVAVAGLLMAGCTQAAPPPPPTAAPAAQPKAVEPTKAPAAPTKPAAEPTKAPAPQPTAAPAPKVDYPAKGKAITVIVPYAVGGSVDLSTRLLATQLQKEFGNQFEVVNKAGAGGEVGTTAVAQARPDGYNLGTISAPGTNTIYLDPTRKSTFTRKDFALIGMHNIDIGTVVVTPNSPYNTINQLVEAAKANPGKVKVATSGLMTPTHLAVLTLQNLTGIKLAVVHFDSGAESQTALLGGHVDAVFTHVGAAIAPQKSGQVRILGVMDKKESLFLPGIKTMEAQGIKLYGSTSRFLAAPGGISKEMVTILTAAMKKVMETDEHKKKMTELAQEQRYLDPAQCEAYWDEWDAEIKPLLSQIR